MRATFVVPVARLGKTAFAAAVDVGIDVPDNYAEFPFLVDTIEHSLHQRVNDATSGLKRDGFTNDEAWATAVLRAAGDVADRITDGTYGVRRKSDPVKAAIAAAVREHGMTPEQLLELVKKYNTDRK